MKDWIKPFGKLYCSVLLCLMMLAMGSCKNDSNKESSEKKDGSFYIVATTGMVKDAAMNVAKEKATVEALMGAGVDPHLYKATQSDLTKLTKADMVLYNGLFLEGKMEEVLEKLALQKPVHAVTAGIERGKLLKTFYGDDQKVEHFDPHVWFDVTLWIKVIEEVSRKLQAFDKDNADYYARNASAYIGQLRALHEKAKTELAAIPEENRILITSHDAFGYFGKAYDIEVRGLQGISTVTEFGLKDVKDLVDYITSKKIPAVFVESSVPQKPLEAVIEGCKEKGHEVKIGGTLFSDAMGSDGTKEGTYIGMVEWNVSKVATALKQAE